MDLNNLLPPEFPEVLIRFRLDRLDLELKLHRDCPGAGAWHVELCSSFSSVSAAFHSLASEEETYSFHYCRRGLFSPNSCPDPLHVNI